MLQENLKKLDKQVEKNKWGMTPSTINAYYTPLKNQIVFPAGILQSTFFTVHATILIELIPVTTHNPED